MADSKLDPNKSYGWTGKILRVNLTDKTVSVSPTDPYKEYLGGMGIANKIMYDEVPAGTDPLSPENKIVFAVGPLTATRCPPGGRTTIASLSTYTTDHQVVDAHTGRHDRCGHQEDRLGCHRHRGRFRRTGLSEDRR